MGIPGILKEIGRGERISLAKYAVEFFEKHNRPLRLAIDIAIWQFQNQSGQGGANPAVRTFYFRLLRLLSLPIHPLFVYDGSLKPSFKRNKSIHGNNHQSSTANVLSKRLLQLFRFPYLTAPGEAEAECAALQKSRIVDAVMSEDVDTLMFGATTVLRDWSAEGNRGNKSPTHVSVLHADKVKASSGLDPHGMILVALLSGGDYDTEGVQGFGPSVSCEIAKAGFGKDLIKANIEGDSKALSEWRERLHCELRDNSSGFFKRKMRSARIPESFPNQVILNYYTNPTITSGIELRQLRADLASKWDQEIDVAALREYTADNFDWKYKTGAKKFIRSFTPAILAHRLRRRQYQDAPSFLLGICDRRQHFDSDAMPELRLEVIPQAVVGLNMHEEQDNPGFAEQESGRLEDENLLDAEGEDAGVTHPQEPPLPRSPRKIRKSPPYDPNVPEKIWLPESIVKIGIGMMAEEWEIQQREIRSDPRKFAMRKCPKATNGLTTQNTISNFLKVQKAANTVIDLGPRKGILSNHQPSQTPMQSYKRTTPARPTLSKTTTEISRKKSSTNQHSKLDGSVNPFTMAQRSVQTSIALLHTNAAAKADATVLMPMAEIDCVEVSPTTVPSSKTSQRSAKRLRPTACESDTDLRVPRTRSKKQALKRAHTDPILIGSSPPGPIAEEISATYDVNSEPSEVPASPSGNVYFVAPKAIHQRPDMEKAACASPSANSRSDRHLQTLTHKTVASRNSLPGFYQEISASDENLDVKPKQIFRSKAERVSLIDLSWKD